MWPSKKRMNAPTVTSWNHSYRSRAVALLRNSLLTRDMLALAVLLVLVCLISRPSLHNSGIDDLDSAHHLMDGYFFRDLIIDHPHSHLPAYVINYYKQYPALGFIFWPPFFPFVLGLFCLAGGTNVLTARICLLCFGIVFSIALYLILRRRLSAWPSFAVVAAGISMPGMVWSFNQIMLELPTLAMMCLAVLAYLHLTDHLGQPGGSIRRGLLCAAACAAVVYTKQPGWFLYPVMMLDFLLIHRRFIRKPEVLIALAGTAVLCLPLALFTIKFGHANLAQSVGANTALIMKQYKALPRWSLAAWTYYPRLAASMVNPVILILAISACVLAAVRRNFLREHALWFGWLFFAYVTFSFYDNRLPRHATFWWPAWIVLAASCLGILMKSMPQRWAWVMPLFLLLPIPLQIRSSWRTEFTDFQHVQAPIAELFEKGDPGNILAFGPDKQMLVALIREHDPDRTVHVVRGERLLEGKQTLLQVCRRYRIGTVLIELPDSESLDKQEKLFDLTSLTRVQDSPFLRRGAPVHILAFHYAGPIDPKMAEVSLSNELF
jgi:hypothetical protein